MFAIVCEEFGPIENLRYKEIDTPEPAAGEVRVAVKAAGVNFPDALLVQGLYQIRPPLPFIPGAEFAGTIDAVGEGVSNFNLGDRVMTFSQQMGGFAEQAVVNARNLIPLHDDIPFTDAANLLCAHGTAHHGLKQRANLQPGENLVVLGAAGGTGLGAVQIGKALGAHVIAVCSNEEKLETARQSGADVLINSSEADLKAAIKEATDGKGADVVYDVVGGDAFHACSRAMARNGRLLVVGFASGDIPELAVNLALVKEYSVVGVFWGSWAAHEPKAFAANIAELFAWYLEGKVSVVTDTEYKLADTATALERIQQRSVKGKLVITT
jgi:NADPH2:quinone reductase